MFDELVKEIKNAVGELRHGTRTRTITVAKPYCSPARHIVTGALEPYGVKIYGFSEAARMANPLDLIRGSAAITMSRVKDIPAMLPISQVAHVTVSESAAGWAEYLLLRTGKLYRVGGYINRRNAAWAAQHGGTMPPAWNEGKPWIESSCSQGVKAWQQVKAASQNAQKQQQQQKGKGRK